MLTKLILSTAAMSGGAIALAQIPTAQVVGGEGTLMGQGVIGVLVSIIGWFVRKELQNIVNEIRGMKAATERNTNMTTIALLKLHELQGATPMLEKIRDESADSLRKLGEQ